MNRTHSDVARALPSCARLVLWAALLALAPGVAAGQGGGWQVQTLPALPAGSSYSIKAVSAIDANHVWVAGTISPGGYGFVARSDDGGSTWSILNQTTTLNGVGRLKMFSTTSGVIGGAYGLLRTTADGGGTWDQEQGPNYPPPGYHNIGPDGHIYGMDAVDISHIWTAGYDGYSAGIIWHRGPERPQEYNTDGSPRNLSIPWWMEWAKSWTGMYAIGAVNSQTAWAAGYAGNLWKTSDGRTWGQQTSGVGGSLNDIAAVDANTAWVVGDSGTILRTTDGGTTWVPQTPPVNDTFRRISAVDTNTAWVVGNHGVILHTTDGGATWTRQPSGTSRTLTGVIALSSTTAWVVTDGAVILKTTDGGTGTWDAPTLTSVSPTSGGRTLRNGVTITGTGFREPISVSVGAGNEASCTYVDTTTLQATLGFATLAGTYDIVVTNGDGQTATLPSAFTFVTEPLPQTMSPDWGLISGGVQITITGSAFQNGAVVYFNTTPATALTTTFVNSTTLTAIVPATQAGGYPWTQDSIFVYVQNPDGQSGIADDDCWFSFFDPSVLNVMQVVPATGSTLGGAAVTITGTSFQAGATVTFADIPATNVVFVNSTTITAVTPPVSWWYDTVNVTVTNPGGQNATLWGFTYSEAPGPTVSLISPASGPNDGGTAVTITGTSFSSPTVTVCDVNAPVTSWASTQVVITTPARTLPWASTPLYCTVRVTNPDSQSASVSRGFTYVASGPAPTLTTVNPSTGSTIGGTTVTLTGTNFVSGATVTFGGTAATSVVFASATSLAAVTPAHTAGQVNVVVRNTDGQSTTLTGGFTYRSTTPTVTQIYPAAGATLGGTAITITGTNFQAGATVTLGGTAATGVVVVSDTTVTIISSPHVAGTVDLVLTSPDGQSVSVPGSFTYSAPTERLYYLAEGSLLWEFETTISIGNANQTDAPVRVTFMKEDGSTVSVDTTVPATAHLAVRPAELAGMPGTSFATVVASTTGLELAVARTMTWDGGHGGHSASASSALAGRWYLAEGAQGYFDTYVVIGNPGATAGTVTITFLVEGGAPIVRQLPIAPTQRLTVFAGDVPGLSGTSFSTVVDATVPVIAERAMYFGAAKAWDGGTAASAAIATASRWYFPEGAQGWYFDTYFCVANPGTTTAHLTYRYLLEDGTAVVTTHEVAGQRRLTVYAGDEDPRVDGAAGFSTEITSDVPIVVERAMYWQRPFASWREGHASNGLTEVGEAWAVADGRVGGSEGYETYLLLMNPATSDSQVRVTFLREGGLPPLVKTATVVAGSRLTLPASYMAPELSSERFGMLVEVTSGPLIVAESAMYWNAGGTFWAGGSSAPGVRMR